MKKLIMALLFIANCTYAQNILKIKVVDEHNQQSIPSAIVQVENTNIAVSTDSLGFAELKNIPDGEQKIQCSFIGFRKYETKIVFPYPKNQPLVIELESESEELNEVIVSTNRSNRTISDIPTRIELISGEELEEKISMQPGNIKMILSESTGIQTQQTSVSSGNTTIRIQGLDGRYTQILKDGLPLYSGFAGGLSLLQIPPLDLKQVEVVKGSASTLYGGGAIAGLINLIPKEPTQEREFTILANGSSALGLDLSTFYAQRFKKFGLTLLGSKNSNEAYDPSGNGFSAIPKFNRYSFNPKLFYYFNERTKLKFGVDGNAERRTGGDMQYLKNKGDSIHSYYEQNDSKRLTSQLGFEHKVNSNSSFNIKNSVSWFDRTIKQQAYEFGGNQLSTFSEVNYINHKQRSEWITGLNVWTDQFNERNNNVNRVRNFSSVTTGGFIQNTFNVKEWFVLESGLRLDYAMVKSANNGNYNDYFVLPRLSALFKINPKVTSRIGGGLGYKTPTVFNEKAEEQVFKNVQPINFNNVKAERSYGANADINYRTSFADEWTFSINQMVFYTFLNKPLVFNRDSLANNIYSFENANGHIDAYGTETNIKIGRGWFKAYLGYTYVMAQTHYDGAIMQVPLTANNRVNFTLLVEKEKKFRIAFEAFYVSPQQLSNGLKSPDYWITGISAEKKWKHFSLFVNVENYTDTRQTRFGSIYTGTVTNPQFNQIYAPLDGIIFNGGIKINL